MYKLFIDTLDVPSNVEIEVEEFRSFNHEEFINKAEKYAQNNSEISYARYVVFRFHNGKSQHKYTEYKPSTGYHAFELEVELAVNKIVKAIEESIQIAEYLNASCLEILEETTPICYLYLMNEKWFPLIINTKYTLELSNYSYQ